MVPFLSYKMNTSVTQKKKDEHFSLSVQLCALEEGILICLLVFSFIMSGAADYPSFRGLLKQLVGPLSTQLSDRRSTIVKQVRRPFLNLHSHFVKDSSPYLLSLFLLVKCASVCFILTRTYITIRHQ